MATSAAYKALLNRCEAAERKLRQAMPTPPKRPEPYIIRFPVARDLWVTLSADKALEQTHWERLHSVLKLQQEFMLDSTRYAEILPDDIGVYA